MYAISPKQAAFNSSIYTLLIVYAKICSEYAVNFSHPKIISANFCVQSYDNMIIQGQETLLLFPAEIKNPILRSRRTGYGVS
jgi:hypothetical protein